MFAALKRAAFLWKRNERFNLNDCMIHPLMRTYFP